MAAIDPVAAPVPVLGRWAKTAAVTCGVAVVALGMVAEGPLGAFDAAACSRAEPPSSGNGHEGSYPTGGGVAL